METTRMSPRVQGDWGELSAMTWLTERGAFVAMPVFHSPDWDLIAELGGDLLRVQVKTATGFHKGRWVVAICTRGGNQSWSGITKYFSAERCDRLFVLVGDGRRWFIPAAVIEGGTAVHLGGPRYAEYEVEPGRPLTAPLVP